jgi:glycosyltransferase involved in cell wall biosynthesis
LTILWLLNIEHQYGLQHGATLRYTNFSRNLLTSGHRVYFVVTNHPGVDRQTRNQYLDTLKKQQCFTGYFEIDLPAYPRWANRLGRLMVHPAPGNRLLASLQNSYKRQFADLIERLHPDLCILSYRPCLFILPEISRYAVTLVDWCDSIVLYYLREMRLLLSKGQFKRMLLDTRHLLGAFSEELFYSRYPDANMVVSHGDKRSLDRLNGRPRINRVIHNGVTIPTAAPDDEKQSLDRLIFTGTMSFPPNYNGAIWFIDHVMPRLLRSHRNIHLVIAGQDPVPQLRARATDRIVITGTVPDMRAEIAQSRLYIAPLFSGTGFRNKVVEAIAAGLYVIGTPMALEFLDDGIRSRLSTAANADEFARLILEYLQAPAVFEQRRQEAMQLLRQEYTWANRTRQLADLCHELIELRTVRGPR